MGVHEVSSDSATRERSASGVSVAEVVFERHVGALGTFSLRPLRLPEDVPLFYRWVSQEYARYWGLVGKSLEQVTASYVEICQHAQVYLGYRGAEPMCLVETYAPADHELRLHYDSQPGDRGMHVLVAPPSVRVAGFTTSVFDFVMDFLFSDPATTRIVVEPDIRNSKIHALNRRAGFRYVKVVQLPNKTAHLAFCTRAQYVAARERLQLGPAPEPAGSGQIAHLQVASWDAANRALLRKCIAEFSHERLLQPALVYQDGDWGHYVLTAADPDTEYRFRARRLELEHWDIDATSLDKFRLADNVPLDAVDFVIEFRAHLGIAATLLPAYLEEMLSTLYAAAYKRANQALSAADLVHAAFQEIEAAMSEGHPAFVANSGRVGFDASDYLAYAPETGNTLRLVWLAAQRRHAEVTTAQDLNYEQLLHEELDAETLERFRGQLRQLDLDPQAFVFIPVHPWQWFNKLTTIFAADIAARDLVCLGYGEDNYRPQQSIRTFFNLSQPHKRYVKTALSVLNMGFMRGLSVDYMRNTPPINDWVHALIAGDAYFAEHGFSILREVAGIGYRNARFEAVVSKSSPYRKMLAALWRESPSLQLRPGERLMTMAALLHRDRDGVALLPQLIQASGVAVDTWLDAYFACYLAPLVHCFYRYDLAFMPHGENVILVLADNVPVRALMKDIAEEVAVMDAHCPLPSDVQRIRVTVPEDAKALSIFTDVFDGIFRHLAQILLEQAAYPEQAFWRRVAACLVSYRRAHPELASKIERYDLFTPEFSHSCLNRLQLRNPRQMLDLGDPAAGLQFAGKLRNPIAAWRAEAALTPPGAAMGLSNTTLAL